MLKNDAAKLSYKKHELYFEDYTKGGKEEKMARTWLNTNTVDSWRHIRMYNSIDPLLLCYPNATWLTVGDGRYGKDAHYIQQKGLSVLATDISDALLKEAKEIGYITDYRKENAESLSFSDKEFDFVLCKEAYHHFPRPMLALYEILRVSKKGVVLIGLNDPFILSTFYQFLFMNLKNFVKFLLRKKIVRHSFEEVGNYVYTISKREIEKVALGLNIRVIAFKELNDYYLKGVEYEKADDNSRLFKKIKRRIALQNFLSKIGLNPYGRLIAIIFKGIPDEKCERMLSKNRYEVIHLPKNPFID